ncbi:MAG: YigZ family protein [Thermoanaerobaculia bacterium]|nr:YigZ family protein [Thermoanaerobaculia bacterium]
MPPDHYRTLAQTAESRQKIERSDFRAIAFHTTSDDDFFAHLHAIEKRHFDATHHCWAFRLFADGETRQRSSDAGEPSGSAGKPILSAIESADLFDLGVVVVRWYGGVKLGTGGLARAYRETANEALRDAPLLDRYLYDRFVVIVPFEMLNAAYRLIAPPNILLTAEDFGDENRFTFDVRRSIAGAFERTLAEKRFQFTR